MSLTSACCVHSNVYGLGNIHWIKYLTVVDPLHSTSSAVQIYFHLTSVPLLPFIGNTSVIGKVPDPQGRPSDSIRTSATISEVSHTEQSITSLTNVLQGHTTVVLVCCTFEWEPDIPFTWEESDVNVLCIQTLFCTYLKLNFLRADSRYALLSDIWSPKHFSILAFIATHKVSLHFLSVILSMIKLKSKQHSWL